MKKNFIVLPLLLCFLSGCGEQKVVYDSVPQYTIVKTDDVSIQYVKRLNVRVLVDTLLSESEIELVCNDLIESQKYKKQGYNAVSFLLYLPNTDTNGQYTAAIAEWAPHGEWSEAGSMLPKDYSDHEFKITIANKVEHTDITGIALDKRMQIFYAIAAIQDSLIALNPNGPSVGEKSLAIAEKKYGLSSKTISEIYQEGLIKNWPIPAL